MVSGPRFGGVLGKGPMFNVGFRFTFGEALRSQ